MSVTIRTYGYGHFYVLVCLGLLHEAVEADQERAARDVTIVMNDRDCMAQIMVVSNQLHHGLTTTMNHPLFDVRGGEAVAVQKLANRNLYRTSDSLRNAFAQGKVRQLADRIHVVFHILKVFWNCQGFKVHNGQLGRIDLRLCQLGLGRGCSQKRWQGTADSSNSHGRRREKESDRSICEDYVAIDEGLGMGKARLKEDPRHSSSLIALMEECRLVIDSGDFFICYLF